MIKFLLTGLTISLLGILSSDVALAHSRYNFGINLGYYNPGYIGYGGHFGYRSYGYPYFYPPLYAYPPYYPPTTVVVPTTPPVYIQDEGKRPAQPQTNYWYYCRNPEGYYPYVKQCPEGWLQVAPQPPDQ